MLSKTTIESAMAALRVCHESLGEPSAYFSVEVQRKHQAEIERALEELHRELVDAPPTVPQGMPEDVRDYLIGLVLAEEDEFKYLTSRGFDESNLKSDVCRKALALLDSAGAE